MKIVTAAESSMLQIWLGGNDLAKSLIITEKPSVAQEFAKILGVSGRNDSLRGGITE